MRAKERSGGTIRSLRRSKGMFQSDLAAAIVALAAKDADVRGISAVGRRTVDPSLISHWEAGRVAVPYHWRPYVAQALDVSESFLFRALEDEEAA